MVKQLKYLSRIQKDFDVVICGVNGVFMYGDIIDKDVVETLIKIYQSGKKLFLASNSGMRVNDLYIKLKRGGIPMNIFNAMITAGEICHFYLKNNTNLGHSYYMLGDGKSCVMEGLDGYRRVDSAVLADFILAESNVPGGNISEQTEILQQAASLNLPFICVGNNTMIAESDKILTGIGAIAEQYAMMGGKVIPFGKPDPKIAAYLTENLYVVPFSRCIIIGDCMATDIRMGNACKAQTLLITNGVHQIKENAEQKVEELSQNYGLNIDYFMEKLQW